MSHVDAGTVGIGDLVRQYRREAGLTQEKLSELAGISVRAVRNLEQGVVGRPRRSTLQLLAGALGLDEDEAARFASVARHSSTSSPPEYPSTVIVVTNPQRWESLTGVPEQPNQSAPTVVVAVAILCQAAAEIASSRGRFARSQTGGELGDLFRSGVDDFPQHHQPLHVDH